MALIFLNLIILVCVPLFLHQARTPPPPHPLLLSPYNILLSPLVSRHQHSVLLVHVNISRVFFTNSV